MRYRLPVLFTLCLLLGIANLMGQGAQQSNSILFTLPSIDGITAVDIRRTGQADITLALNEKWAIAPDSAEVDPDALAGLLTLFDAPIPMDYATSDNETPEQYGISEHSITVHMRKGKELISAFRVGKVVDGRRTFIQDLQTERIYRAQADLRSIFDRPTFDWRNRRFFRKTFAEIQAIERIEGTRTRWHIARDENGASWSAISPKGIEVGQREADAIANTLATAEAIALGTQETFSSQFILQARTFSRESLTLEIGVEHGDGTIDVRVPGGPVMKLPRHQKIFLLAQAEDLRNRRVFDLDPQSVVGVSLAGPEALILTKNTDGWAITSPSPQTSLPRGQADAFLEALLSLKALGFGSAEQFGQVEDILVIRGRDDRILTLEIGAIFGQGRYARLKERPNRVFIMPLSAIQLTRTPRAILEARKPN